MIEASEVGEVFVSLGRHSLVSECCRVGMVLYSYHTQNFGSWDGCHLILNVDQSGLFSVVARVLPRLIVSCLRLMPAIWTWMTLRLVVRARFAPRPLWLRGLVEHVWIVGNIFCGLIQIPVGLE